MMQLSLRLGKVTLVDYGEYTGSKEEGALSPIYQALGLNFQHNFVGKLVITEGVSDFFLLKMLQKNTNLISKELTIIPGAGAHQLTTLISFALSHATDFVVLLDNDEAGKKGLKKYTNSFGDSVAKKVHLYRSDRRKWELEDFLSEADAKHLQKVTGSTDLKRSIGFLFYDHKDEQSNFIKSLNKETKDNLKPTLDILKELTTE